MGIASDIKGYARFAWGLHGFLHRTVTTGQAWDTIRRRLAERDDSFLRVLRRGVFEHEGSPYRRLFEMGGCSFGDVEKMVRADGVEHALGRLYGAGVYVSFDEFKGRVPLVRNGKEFRVAARDFDNPHLRRTYQASTSGSTGAGTRISFELDQIAEDCCVRIATREAHGVLGIPTVVWRNVLPSVAGLNHVFCCSLQGNLPERWFTPLGPKTLRISVKDRAAMRYVLLAARLSGRPLPEPEPVPLGDPMPILDWAVEAVKRTGACLVSTFVSPAVRACAVAREKGLDLTGVTFMGGGEPATAAKIRAIESVGARALPTYGTSEAGVLGVACARPCGPDDLHLAQDLVALIQRPYTVPGWGETVGVFCLTTLVPTAPKIMINVVTDDFGILETRTCGCPFEAAGYPVHLHTIRSYRKLTGEGVTLLGNDAARVLEEVLPSRFGGSPLDYQLLEEEDGEGLTRLSLIISPRITLNDEQAAMDLLLEGLRRSGPAGSYAAAFWKQGGSLRVKRTEPIWGAGGKFLPLCVAERWKAASAGERR